MANQVRAVRRNSAISPLLIFLAPIFAIASFAYTLLSPTSPPSVFQSFLWRALGRELHKTLYADEWLMQSRVFNQNKFQAYPYVSNGYFGQTLPAEGVGYWVQQNKSVAAGGFSANNWPLDEPRATFGTIAGFFNLQDRTNRIIWPPNLARGGESVISGIPDWTGLVVTTEMGESYLPGVDASEVKAYVQSMSLRNGMVQTNISWVPNRGDTAFQLNFTVFAHQKNINLGVVRLDIMASQDIDVTITDVLDGAGATRATFQLKSSDPDQDLIWTSVSPTGQQSVVAFEYSTVQLQTLNNSSKGICKTHRGNNSSPPWTTNNASTIAQSWCLQLQQGVHSTVYKYVGIAATDAFKDATQSTARQEALKAKGSTWEDLVQSHNNAWDDLWESADIIIPSDKDIQKVTRASLFHLLTNIRPAREGPGVGDNSISPSGLSSDSYAGYIFWDADSWVAPSLVALHPERAASINNYRSKLHTQAQNNTKRNEFREFSGALYPWTSGRFGNCTGNGICAGYQYHINADIAMAHWHYFLYTSDLEWLRDKAWPIILDAAEMFVDFVQFSQNFSNGSIWTFAITDPDEDAIQVNNGAYTNAAIKLLLGSWGPAAAQLLNISVPSTWADIASAILIPFNSNGDLIEEYTGMPGDIQIKQADVVLINYPLDYKIDPQIARNNLEYYSLRNSPSGPQMTWSMHSIAEAELQTDGCATYTYLLYSVVPYIRLPFFQFSELIEDDASKNGGTEPAFPFLTGHGGYLQIFTHGLTGMRPHSDALYFNPTLPPQLSEGGVQINGIKWRGAVLDIDIQIQTTTIYRRKGANSAWFPIGGPVQIRVGPENPKAGDYLLHMGQTLRIPTRQPHLNGRGNHALCKSVSSDEDYVSGNFPLSVVDGSPSSIWRPSSSSNRSGFTVDLGKHIENLQRVEISWGVAPPEGFSVSLRSNDAEAWIEVLKMDKISISAPYDPKMAKEVRILNKNISAGVFDNPAAARYVRLTVWGTQGIKRATGSTVSEFKIF